MKKRLEGLDSDPEREQRGHASYTSSKRSSDEAVLICLSHIRRFTDENVT